MRTTKDLVGIVNDIRGKSMAEAKFSSMLQQQSQTMTPTNIKVTTGAMKRGRKTSQVVNRAKMGGGDHSSSALKNMTLTP